MNFQIQENSFKDYVGLSQIEHGFFLRILHFFTPFMSLRYLKTCYEHLISYKLKKTAMTYHDIIFFFDVFIKCFEFNSHSPLKTIFFDLLTGRRDVKNKNKDEQRYKQRKRRSLPPRLNFKVQDYGNLIQENELQMTMTQDS